MNIQLQFTNHNTYRLQTCSRVKMQGWGSNIHGSGSGTAGEKIRIWYSWEKFGSGSAIKSKWRKKYILFKIKIVLLHSDKKKSPPNFWTKRAICFCQILHQTCKKKTMTLPTVSKKVIFISGQAPPPLFVAGPLKRKLICGFPYHFAWNDKN